MSFINKHKGKIIALIGVIAILTFTFLWEGKTPATPQNNTSVSEPHIETVKKAAEKSKLAKKTEIQNEEKNVNEQGETVEILPEEVAHPEPIDPANVTISQKELKCTLSVRCDTLVDNKGSLPEEKKGLVPADGIIFPETEVMFYEGESVFNLLLREMKRNKIHFEFVNTPLYNSVYIEGINNLYEFDAGELSGWMYKVNSWFPNYGSSLYQLKADDKVEIVYSCDLGKDVGGEYAPKNH